MSSFTPPWSQWYGPRSRGAAPDAQMRVSDAERSQIAESLSKHYSDGRLDEVEFNERLQRAMSAKTRGDLSGLLVDLPADAPPPRQQARRGGRLRPALLFLVVFLVALALSSSMWAWHFPWLLFGVILFFVWRGTHRGHYHRHHYGVGWGPGAPRLGSRTEGPYPDERYGAGPGTWV